MPYVLLLSNPILVFVDASFSDCLLSEISNLFPVCRNSDARMVSGKAHHVTVDFLLSVFSTVGVNKVRIYAHGLKSVFSPSAPMDNFWLRLLADDAIMPEVDIGLKNPPKSHMIKQPLT